MPTCIAARGAGPCKAEGRIEGNLGAVDEDTVTLITFRVVAAHRRGPGLRVPHRQSEHEWNRWGTEVHQHLRLSLTLSGILSAP